MAAEPDRTGRNTPELDERPEIELFDVLERVANAHPIDDVEDRVRRIVEEHLFEQLHLLPARLILVLLVRGRGGAAWRRRCGLPAQQT